MRTTTVLTALLPAALSSVIPASTEPSHALSLDKRQEVAHLAHRGESLQADVYAGVAASNQQTYQAKQRTAQWETCNSSNTIVRREW
jgi:tyrosinase